jgi:ubiquinone biosynthesis protein COQ4
MSHHNFSADERPSVKHVEDDELAYVVLRYRQVHDFWHVLADLPPTILGEVALKCFEWRITGLPSCGMAAVAGPLRLSYQERNTLLVQYIPWALRSATECEDLMAYPYEKHLHRTVEDIREELNLEPAPK